MHEETRLWMARLALSMRYPWGWRGVTNASIKPIEGGFEVRVETIDEDRRYPVDSLDAVERLVASM